MGALRRVVKFGAGGIVGAAIGAIGAALAAPQSGGELQTKVDDRIRRAKVAREEAKVAKTEELISRFRQGVNAPTALDDEREKTRIETAEKISAIGLGLNAPGALAAQETALRSSGE
ncbi:MAG: hypothetical protein ACRDJW_02500 [Thermomicrobiales bacterium]